ncbi:hypothetical protein FAGKG844_130021 [Frankia sp. AgKG'84/4]
MASWVLPTPPNPCRACGRTAVTSEVTRRRSSLSRVSRPVKFLFRWGTLPHTTGTARFGTAPPAARVSVTMPLPGLLSAVLLKGPVATVSHKSPSMLPYVSARATIFWRERRGSGRYDPHISSLTCVFARPHGPAGVDRERKPNVLQTVGIRLLVSGFLARCREPAERRVRPHLPCIIGRRPSSTVVRALRGAVGRPREADRCST